MDLNQHFKVDPKSVEKSKVIREIFEIDDLLKGGIQPQRPSAVNRSTVTNTVKDSSKLKSMSQVKSFNTNIYFKPSNTNSCQSNSLNQKKEDDPQNRDKLSFFINNIIETKVNTNQPLTKSSTLYKKESKLILKQKQKQPRKDKAGNTFLSFLQNLVFGKTEEQSDENLVTNYDTIENGEEGSDTNFNIPILRTKDLNSVKRGNSNSHDEGLMSPIRSTEGKPNFVFDNVNSSRNVIPKKTTTSSSFKVDDNKEKKSDTKSSSSWNVQEKSPNIAKNNLLYVPCINCNNMILLEEVEIHSNNCIVIKEDVNKVETSKYAYHVVDYKLKKILEHLQVLQKDETITNSKKSTENLSSNNNKGSTRVCSAKDSSTGDLSKENHIFHILETTTKDTINVAKISNSSLSTLKKFLINLDSITHSFKGTWTTSILIDRCRVLTYEKMNILKKSLKELNESRRTTVGKKTAIPSDKINILKETLMKEKEKKEKLNDDLESEKEMIKRKTAVLKESTKNILSSNVSSSSSTKDLNLIQTQSQETNLIHHEKNKIEPVRSLLENTSKHNRNHSNYSNCEEEEKRSRGIIPKPKFTSDSHSPELKKSREGSLNNSKNFDYYDNLNLDTEEDKVKDYMNIDSNTVNVNRNLLNEITSDVDSKNVDDISDCTSMTSNTSFKSHKDMDIPKIPEKKPHNYIVDAKKLYQDFVKAVLKVKFEKIHNTHKGQDVPERVLFKECIKRNIPESEWSEFIQNELKNPEKYSDHFKVGNKKMRVLKNQTVYLDTIKEENL